MIKPIAYHDVREKIKLEAKLFSKIPLERRMAVSREFIDLFANLRKPDADQKHNPKRSK